MDISKPVIVGSFYKFVATSNWAKNNQRKYEGQPCLCLATADKVNRTNGLNTHKFLFRDGHVVITDSEDLDELPAELIESLKTEFHHSQVAGEDPFYFRKIAV